MGLIERQLETFERILLLHRAEEDAPRVTEITEVRGRLEDDLGGGVSMRMAGRVLGVSDATVRRWVRSGDLPTVIDSSGRQVIPIGVVVELRAETDHQRETGRRHVLEASMRRRRRDADKIDTLVQATPARPSRDPHERAAARALAYHRAVAAKLDREIVDSALRRLWSWRSRGKVDPRHADTWDELLHRPIPEIRRRIVGDDAAGRDLRQNSPFAGSLSEAERRRIFELIR